MKNLFLTLLLAPLLAQASPLKLEITLQEDDFRVTKTEPKECGKDDKIISCLRAPKPRDMLKDLDGDEWVSIMPIGHLFCARITC